MVRSCEFCFGIFWSHSKHLTFWLQSMNPHQNSIFGRIYYPVSSFLLL